MGCLIPTRNVASEGEDVTGRYVPERVDGRVRHRAVRDRGRPRLAVLVLV